MKTNLLLSAAVGAILPCHAMAATNLAVKFTSVSGPCARYPGSDSFNCMICVPYDTVDAMGASYDWWSLGASWAATNAKAQCASIGCTNFPTDTTELKNHLSPIGDVSQHDAFFNYYECRGGQWQQRYHENTQEIWNRNNGRYENCKNPRMDENKTWTCDSYTAAYCNNGYYGIYKGGTTDCKPCPDIPARYANNGGDYYYLSREAEPGASSHSSDIGNTTIAGCYIEIQSNSAPYMKDDSGYYQLTDECYYSN